MPPGLTQLQVINRSLTEIQQGSTITSLVGVPGSYAATLYSGAVETLLRESDYEFSRMNVDLTLSGNAAPLGWLYEYLYPSDCIRLRQVAPATLNPFDPAPNRWDVGTSVVSGVQTTVIWTNAANAQAVYTTDNVTESDWDSIFTEAMVRYLGSQLALPVAGRPDFSKQMLTVSGRLIGAGQNKDS
jgi:hypothetical protein